MHAGTSEVKRCDKFAIDIFTPDDKKFELFGHAPVDLSARLCHFIKEDN